MKLSNLFTTVQLFEAKARIEHPEDLIFDGGRKGAITALQILQTTADKPQSVSIKFDGSPALIFGWRGDEFILTDKAGFGAKGYDGLTTNGDAIEQMIMNRKMKDTSPQAVAKRQSYARTIASLYPILKAAVPKSFKGYAQGDLLYVGTPKLSQGQYQFKPNKIEYKVSAATPLGKLIGKSKVGMVVHSVFQSPQDEEPEALRDVHRLGWKSMGDLVVVPHEIELTQALQLNPRLFTQAKSLLNTHADQINKLFDPLSLADRNIKALPGLMKAFLAYKAGEGDNDFSKVAQEFINWLTSASSKASAKMQTSVGEWIRENIDGYNSVWEFVKLIVDLKLDLKSQMDQQVGTIVSAELENKPGHEGFVSVTPNGIIKLVHRAEFMKKDKPEAVSEQTDVAAPTKSDRVVFTFMRANPPTPGHKLVVDQVKKLAHNDDYWVFLSHSQDPKKNPLSWQQKHQFAQLIMPEHEDHFAHDDRFTQVKTPLLAADWLYNQGYRDLTMVVGSDRVASMTDILTGWNSEPIRSKYNREPVKIKVVSAGERDPDADDVTGISASKVRELVAQNDFDGFKAAVGMDQTSAKQMFDAVQSGMQTKKGKAVKEGNFNSTTVHTGLSEDEHDQGTIAKLILDPDSSKKLYAWCEAHGIDCIEPYNLHSTLMYSKTPAPELAQMNGTETRIVADIVGWKILGSNVLTLELHCPIMNRMHEKFKQLGAVHEYSDFIPHTSVVYGWNHSQVPDEVPDMKLVFEALMVEGIDPTFSKNK